MYVAKRVSGGLVKGLTANGEVAGTLLRYMHGEKPRIQKNSYYVSDEQTDCK